MAQIYKFTQKYFFIQIVVDSQAFNAYNVYKFNMIYFQFVKGRSTKMADRASDLYTRTYFAMCMRSFCMPCCAMPAYMKPDG